MKRTRHDLLVGVDAAPVLRAAARELDAVGRKNARIAEVDARAHDYAPVTQEVWYFERQNADGSWTALGLSDIALQGTLEVTRVERENLEPAMRWQLIQKLVRGGVYNEWQPAKDYVIEQCVLRCAGRTQ